MSRRCHIIYAHPAGNDGYSFFYLYYWPGDRQLALRYRQGEDDVKEISLAPVAMLDLMENQAGLRHVEAGALRPWDRGAKALRVRIRTWADQARQDAD